MFFRKCVHKKVSEIAANVRIDENSFSEIPGFDCKIAQNGLRYEGKPLCLDFAEAQMLTRELSKNYGLEVRLPTLEKDFTAFQKLKTKSQLSEWKAEFLDGSFLMVNPEVRVVNNPREYDFGSQFKIIDMSRYSNVKNNGNLCWLGITKDRYDRAAFTSYFGKEGYSAGAVPPLSKESLGIRLLIEEK